MLFRSADVEAEVLMAKQQGRDMVEEARAYRERVLADVARRRELAREQIEDLIHGRDRLAQAFERARIASDDVLRDLADAADEPTEYVNLAHTTGPVPIMVPVDEVASVRTRPSAFYDQDHEDAVEEIAAHPHPSIEVPAVVTESDGSSAVETTAAVDGHVDHAGSEIGRAHV